MIRTCGLAALFLTASTVSAADHLDSPSVMEDGRLDINDVYAFQSPSDANNTVLIMTVNPAAGVLSPMTFNPLGKYQFNIDTDGDALADITYEITFGTPRSGTTQSVIVRRNGRLVARGSTGGDFSFRRGGGTVRCDVFDDPFFFDLNGFSQTPSEIDFTGTDFFAGLNVSAIVMELPSTELGSDTIGVWARTEIGGEQFDRTGRPAITSALIPSGTKDAFNASVPSDDPANYGDVVEASITTFSGDADYAATVTAILLPDILTIDTSSSAGFEALNGRKPADDVIDIELDLLTMGGLGTDGVDANDVAFPGTFPYLAPPNE